MLFQQKHNFRYKVEKKIIKPLKVALVCIAKNEDNTIAEWINYNKKLGFTKIFMYENDWNCPVDDHILKKIKISGKNKQVHAYNHWLAKYKYNYDYAAFFDCDEFIVLKQHNNIIDFMTRFQNKYGMCINWCLFGSMGQLEAGKNKNSLLKRFTFRDKKPDKCIKTILNTKRETYFIHPHHSITPTMDTDGNIVHGPFNPKGKTNYVQLNHYFHKSFEEWKNRIERGQPTKLVRKLQSWEERKNRHNEVQDLQALNWFYK